MWGSQAPPSEVVLMLTKDLNMATTLSSLYKTLTATFTSCYHCMWHIYVK